MAVGVFLYALQATMSGVTAGEDRWYLFAAVGGLESAGRLILMLAAALMIPSLAGSPGWQPSCRWVCGSSWRS